MHIPPGRHVIKLHYWPKRFTQGILLAALALALAGLVAAAFIAWRRKSRVVVSGQPSG